MHELIVLDKHNREVHIDIDDIQDGSIKGMSLNDEELFKTFMGLFTQNDKIDPLVFTQILLIVDKHKHKLKHLTERSAKNGYKLDDMDRFFTVLLQDNFDKELKTEKFLKKQE